MAQKSTGFVIARADGVAQGLAEQLGSFMEMLGQSPACASAWEAIEQARPDAVFIDLSEEPEAAFALCRRLKRARRDTAVFLVGREKDPELILRGLRAGAADYLVFPGADTDVASAVRQALGRADAGGSLAEAWAVFSLKGGQGATTLAVNLADQLAMMHGGQVVLADLNLYMGHVTTALDFPCSYTPFDLVRDSERIDDNLLFSSLSQHPRGFYVLGVSGELCDGDQLGGEDAALVLDVLKRHADFVVQDLPHDFSPRTLAALNAADRVLLVVQQDVQSLKSAQRCLDVFQDLGYSEDKIRIVLNRHVRRGQITASDVASVLERPLAATISNDYRNVAATHTRGQTLAATEPKCRVNRELAALAARLAGVGAPATGRTGWRSFFRPRSSRSQEGS